MTDEHPIVPERLRRIPRGFGWVDHRLLKNGFRSCRSADALAQYLLRVCATDGDGLSICGDAQERATQNIKRGDAPRNLNKEM